MVLAGLTQAKCRTLFGEGGILLLGFGGSGASKQRRKSRVKGLGVVGDEIGVGWEKEGPAGEKTGQVDNLEERVDAVKFGGGSRGMKSHN